MGRFVLVVALLTAGSVRAAQITWTNAGGTGEFTTAGNWSPAQVPGIADEAFFNGSTSNASCNISSTITVGNIHSANGYTGTVTIPNGVTVTVDDGAGLSVIAYGTWQINGTLKFIDDTLVQLNGGTYNLVGFIDVDAPVIINSASIGGDGHLIARGNVTFGGPFTPTGTWALEMSGTSQTIYASSSASINHLAIKPTSTTVLVNTPLVTYLRVKYDVVIEDGGKLDLSAADVTLTVGAQFSAGLPEALAVSSPSARIIFDGARTQYAYTRAILPSVEITNGGSVEFMDPATVNGHLSVGAGTTLTTDHDLTVTSLEVGGTLTRPATSVLRFVGTGSAGSLGGSPLGTCVFAGVTTLTSDVSVGDVSLEGELQAGSRTIVVTGNWTTVAGGIYGKAAGQTVRFVGAAGQTVNVSSDRTMGPFADVSAETPGTLRIEGDIFASDGTFAVAAGTTAEVGAHHVVLTEVSVADQAHFEWSYVGGALELGTNGRFEVAAGGHARFFSPSGTVTFGPAATLEIDAGAQMVIMGGDPSTLLTLEGVSPGVAWNLVDNSAPDATVASLLGMGASRENPTYVAVRDCHASGTAAPIRPGPAMDQGGDVNWDFGVVLATDKVSPYTCAVGGGSHPGLPWPLLATLILLARRRRLKSS